MNVQAFKNERGKVTSGFKSAVRLTLRESEAVPMFAGHPRDGGCNREAPPQV